MFSSAFHHNATSIENNVYSEESNDGYFRSNEMIEFQNTDKTDSFFNNDFDPESEMNCIYELKQNTRVINQKQIDINSEKDVEQHQISFLNGQYPHHEELFVPCKTMKILPNFHFLVEFQQISSILHIKSCSNLEIDYQEIEQVNVCSHNSVAKKTEPELAQNKSEFDNSTSIHSHNICESETQDVLNQIMDEQKKLIEFANIQNSIELVFPYNSFQVSNFFKFNQKSNSFSLKKTFLSQNFLSLFSNSNEFDNAQMYIRQKVMNVLKKIEQGSDYCEIQQSILANSLQFYIGQIISETSIQQTTDEGLEIQGKCVWQVFPLCQNSRFDGILIKQIWNINNFIEITRQKQQKFSKDGISQTLSLQQQAEKLEANFMDQTLFSVQATKFLRKFKYIQKQKKRKVPLNLQELYPEKTCKYKSISWMK